MKRLSVILAVAAAFILCPCVVRAVADDEGPVQPTDRNREALLVRMNEYLNAMDTLPIPEAEAEADYMISAIGDSLFRNRAAVEAYRHFRASKHMGSENVAIHIYDRWFASYKAVFDNIDELDEAELYAFVNRRSLIGCRAPELLFEDADGDTLAVPSSDGRRSIVFFYSVGCPKCLYISLTMSKYLNESNPDLDLFTIYTGEDEAAWQLYTERELAVTAPSVNVHHLRGGLTEYATAYGVIQTPRLFLVDESGVIIGRNLDTEALSKLLE